MITQRSQLNFSLIDGSDSIGNMSFWLADGVDLATVVAAAANLRSRIEACSDAVFIRQAIVHRFVESPRPEPAAISDVTRVGGLIFSCATGELDIIELASIKDECLQSTGPGAELLINRSHPAMVALINEMITGIWCSPFAFDIQRLEAAYLQIRR